MTVIGRPTEGVITTVAEYVPAVKLATFTVKEVGVDCPAVLLPLVGDTVNQVCEGVPVDQVKVPPPRF